MLIRYSAFAQGVKYGRSIAQGFLVCSVSVPTISPRVAHRQHARRLDVAQHRRLVGVRGPVPVAEIARQALGGGDAHGGNRRGVISGDRRDAQAVSLSNATARRAQLFRISYSNTYECCLPSMMMSILPVRPASSPVANRARR